MGLDRFPVAFQGSLAPIIFLANFITELVVFAVLIERIVREVDAGVIDVVLVWLLVVLGAESGQPLFVEVRNHRLNAQNGEVKAQVVFFIVNQQRVIDVPLNYDIVIFSNFF